MCPHVFPCATVPVPVSVSPCRCPRARPARGGGAAGNWFQMVSAQERLTRTFTRSSHTYTRTERTEISKTRGGETKREVRVEESTQVGGDPFPNVFGDFLGREGLGAFSSIARGQEGACGACVCRGVRVPAPGAGCTCMGACLCEGWVHGYMGECLCKGWVHLHGGMCLCKGWCMCTWGACLCKG